MVPRLENVCGNTGTDHGRNPANGPVRESHVLRLQIWGEAVEDLGNPDEKEKSLMTKFCSVPLNLFSLS